MRATALGALIGGVLLILGQILIPGAKTLGFTGALCVGLGLIGLGVAGWARND